MGHQARRAAGDRGATGTEIGLLVALLLVIVATGARHLGQSSTGGFEAVAEALPSEGEDGGGTPNSGSGGSGAGSSDGGGSSGGGGSTGGGGSSGGASPTAIPTAVPTAVPTVVPTAVPTAVPAAVPTPEPTVAPTASPTAAPTPNVDLTASGFEDGQTRKFKKYNNGSTTASGWAVSTGNVQTQKAASVSGISPTEGSRYLDLNGTKPGGISQNVDVANGSMYTLTLDIASATGGDSGNRTAVITWDGHTVATIDMAQGSNWHTMSVQLPATSNASATLSITSTNSGTSGVYIDNLALG